ncbi:hypothetical protein QNH10_14495 [Sporosarcina thermotolerans]|uniref:hypothetical protein n=1 Tax=Sporosarcina thermotolerans TaxID=633404 RepID=UPI0024BCBB98|nr:hypothetical protein [Sporosarcina thermotolerans]WHT47396.1 hypothetical protein QNH10_14495 [Sporosarcina thermotolerans]
MNKKNIILLVLLLFGLSACSVPETVSLENRFKEIMVEHNNDFDSVWHFEVKEDVVIVFYEKDQSLNIGFIRDKQGDWEWITGTGSIDLKDGGYIATAEMGLPFYITAVVNNNDDIKGISVRGEYAKLVQISPQDKFWFAFTNKPASGIDIEEIKS